jgi:hypothetical protein
MIGRDMCHNPQSTLMKTLKANIRDAVLSDEAREIAEAMIESIEISIKSFFDGERESSSEEGPTLLN